MHSLRRFRVLGIAVALAFGCVGVPASAGRDGGGPPSLAELEVALTEVSSEVQPAVVEVFASGYSSSRGRSSLLSRQLSSGSGFVITNEGHIVTNAHVVLGADRVEVRIPRARARGDADTSEGERVEADILGIDIETDLAVLRVPVTGTPHLEWGDSTTVKVGQPVLAFGSPFGLQGSVSLGIVSAVGRQLSSDDPRSYLQTDAAISPGNSGGPLVDIRGRVVGVNTMLVSQTPDGHGPGIAVPSRVVKRVVDQLIDRGRVTRGEVGARFQTLNPRLRKGLELTAAEGALVSDVFPGGPAERGGLRPQDVVIEIDGKPVSSAQQLITTIYEKPVGGQTSMRVVRGRERLSVDVRIAERVDDPSDVLELVNPRDLLVDRLDVLAVVLDDTLLRLLPALRSSAGLIVADVGSDNPAQLLPGDVIVQVGKHSVKSRAELESRLDQIPAAGEVLLRIERDGVYEYAVVSLD